MKDEFSDRHQAIKMRLAGQSIEIVCQTLDGHVNGFGFGGDAIKRWAQRVCTI